MASILFIKWQILTFIRSRDFTMTGNIIRIWMLKVSNIFPFFLGDQIVHILEGLVLFQTGFWDVLWFYIFIWICNIKCKLYYTIKYTISLYCNYDSTALDQLYSSLGSFNPPIKPKFWLRSFKPKFMFQKLDSKLVFHDLPPKNKHSAE